MRNTHDSVDSIFVVDFNLDDQISNAAVLLVEHQQEDPVVDKFTNQHPPLECLLLKRGNTAKILRAVYKRELKVTVLGNHPVAAALAVQ